MSNKIDLWLLGNEASMGVRLAAAHDAMVAHYGLNRVNAAAEAAAYLPFSFWEILPRTLNIPDKELNVQRIVESEVERIRERRRKRELVLRQSGESE